MFISLDFGVHGTRLLIRHEYMESMRACTHGILSQWKKSRKDGMQAYMHVYTKQVKAIWAKPM